jgi:hypothetical protein
MITEYLVRYNGTWQIARPCVVHTIGWPDEHLRDRERVLAWCTRDGGIVCLDADEPEVKDLPE